MSNRTVIIITLDTHTVTAEDIAIVTLKDLCEELSAPQSRLRTVIIERDLPFEIIGVMLVFNAKRAEAVRNAWKDHVRKGEALGLKARPRKEAVESATA